MSRAQNRSQCNIWCITLAAMAIVLLWSASSNADQRVIAGAGSSLGHAWMVVPMHTPAEPLPDSDAARQTGILPEYALIHFPPRIGPDGSIQSGAESGSIRMVTRLYEEPEWIGAWGDRVYLLFDNQANLANSDAPDRATGHTILTMRAATHMQGGIWLYEPAKRLDSLPKLNAKGHIAGFSATAQGPVALLRQDSRLVLATLSTDGVWQVESLPKTIPDLSLITLLTDDQGLLLLGASEGDSNVQAWSGRSAESDSIWAWNFITPPGLDASWLNSANDRALISASGNIVGVRLEQDSNATTAKAQLWLFQDTKSIVLTDIPGAEAGKQRVLIATAPLNDVGRVVALSVLEPEQAKPSAMRTLEIMEVSTGTGMTLYSGKVKGTSPVTTDDARLLGIILVTMMAMLILFMIKPGDRTARVVVSDIYAPAFGLSRLFAGLIDIAPGLMVFSLATGEPVMQMLAPWSWFTGQASNPSAILTIMAVGFGHSALFEGLFGASIGKLLTGCVVCRLVPGSDEAKARVDAEIDNALLSERSASGESAPVFEVIKGAGFRGAAVRNAVRWFVPPLAILGMSDVGGRHMGDVLGRTIVLQSVKPSSD